VSATAPPVAGLVARPRLFALLDAGARVTLVCAPAGSGKTMLVSSWLAAAELEGGVAWVGVEREESDATRFWGMVMDALRRTEAIAPDDPLATLVPAPLGGQDEFAERLIDGLGRLPRPMVLILDDVHELHAHEALRGLERLLARAPAQLRVIVVSRRDLPLALHRLRLTADLVEIRAADLGFTVDETAELLAGAHVEIAGADVARLQERTEGWAAGLRLAALSLARHDAPERFVAEFSGSERTVADYLVQEVLARQPEELRRLLMRTSILARVNGSLADLLTGRTDGTRMLHALEEANAFVVAVDVARTWFRYHHLLADLMRLELRREAPRRSPGCTASRAAGTPSTATSWRRSGTRSRAATWPSPPSCSAASGSTSYSTARSRRSPRCSPACPPSWLTRTPRSPPSPRSTASHGRAGPMPTRCWPPRSARSTTCRPSAGAAPRPRSGPCSCSARAGSATSTRCSIAPRLCCTPTTSSPPRWRS